MLIPQFSMLAFTAAVEPLRAANRLSGKTLFEWKLYACEGGSVAASNGIKVLPDEPLTPTTWPEALFVCAGLDAQAFRQRPALQWLRTQARRGIVLGAMSTGTYLLARAGLLNGYRCTIHWESRPAFSEEFPSAQVTGRLFEIDRNRLTCSGGTAAMDLMLNLIARDHGVSLSTAVSNQFHHDRVRTSADHQRMAEQLAILRNSPKLAHAIAVMESHIEVPLAPRAVAQQSQMSLRQLERLFHKYRGSTPQRHYTELRLRHARQLLLETGLSVLDVSLATGFASQSHFTKCYREHFGLTPSQERRIDIQKPTIIDG